MLSKNKVSKAVVAWIGDQLADIQIRGASLIDEVGGDSVHVVRLRQSGSSLIIDVDVFDSSDKRESFELCLRIHGQVDHPKSTPTPTQAELDEIDSTS